MQGETEIKGYDYVIAGGGSAGCTLAARLSEDPNVTVCLVEAGKTHKHWSVMVLKKRNWAFETVPQKGLNGRLGYQPRGKMLGGSSGSNAMIYIRGHKADWRSSETKDGATKTCFPISKSQSTGKRARTNIMAKTGRSMWPQSKARGQ